MRKVLFIGNDDEIKKEYQKLDNESEFFMVTVEEAAMHNKVDCLIISDKMVTSLELEAVIKTITSDNKYYLISNAAKDSVVEVKIALAKKHDMIPIMPRNAVNTIVKKILGIESDEHTYKNVCAIMGTHAQVGATTVALNLAYKLAQKSMKVCVLGFNQFNPGTVFIKKYTGNTLDEMYDQIVDSREKLTPDKLIRFMHKDEELGFSYLAGNKDYSKQGYFNTDEIRGIVEIASNSHDLVLLDLGSNPSTNLTLEGLSSANIKLIIANQQQTSINSWLQMNADVLRLLQFTKDEFMLVINKYRLDVGRDQKYISSIMEVPLMLTITDYGNEGTYCEMESKLLVESGQKGVKKQSNGIFEELANALVSRLDIGQQRIGAKEKKLWGFSK